MTWQAPEWLSMTALGTSGGEPMDCGANMATGVHLRWRVSRDLGFPQGGFDVFRRQVGALTWACTDLGPLGAQPATFTLAGTTFTASPGAFGHDAGACGGAGGFSLTGAQVVTVRFAAPVAASRVRVSGPAGTEIEIYAEIVDGATTTAVAASKVAGGSGTQDRIVQADRIDQVRIIGTNFRFCQICVSALPTLTTGWGAPLNPIPIQLPVTRAGWPGVHANTPNDNAEAAARVGTFGMSGPKVASYMSAFTTRVHGLLFGLVGHPRQADSRTGGVGTRTTVNDRPSPEAGFAIIDVLEALALDRVHAHLFGLAWVDNPGAGSFDYRVVAHYGGIRWPGRTVDIPVTALGTRATLPYDLGDAGLACPRPIYFDTGTWSGEVMRRARVDPVTGIDAPVVVATPTRPPACALWVSCSAAFTVRWYLDGLQVGSASFAAGPVVVEAANAGGIGALTLTCTGTVEVYRVILRAAAGTVGDVNYVSLRRECTSVPASPVLNIVPSLRPLNPRSGEQQDTVPDAVSLDWSRVGFSLPVWDPTASVLARVERDERGTGASPGAVTATIPVTTTPVAAFPPGPTEAPASPRPAAWSGAPGKTVDWNVPRGWHDYRVRGIDLFGRLGPWGANAACRVLPSGKPPPPIELAAAWLQEGDRWLDADDLAWVTSNGPGVRVEWTWPGFARLAAPLVEGSGEFRLYWREGRPNVHTGRVTAVVDSGSTSTLATDWSWTGAAGAFAGGRLRVGNSLFPIVAHGTGAAVTIEVENLTGPPEIPAVGSFALTVAEGGPGWVDVTNAPTFDQRFHVEAAGTIPAPTGLVTSVTPAIGGGWRVLTDQVLADDDTLVVGILTCRGMVFGCLDHALGTSNLSVRVRPIDVPGGGTSLPAVGDTFHYFPGRSYQTRIAGPSLAPASGQATALALVAAASSDNVSTTADLSLWSAAGRGGNGGRPGNEGALSRAARVIAVRRSEVTAAGTSATEDTIQAEPADYHGIARAALTWDASPDAATYVLYRSTTARVFDADRENRRTSAGYYASTDPFDDDPEVDDWIAETFPWLERSDLFRDLDTADDADILRMAWRLWAERFYGGRTWAEVRVIGGREGNEGAYERVSVTPLADTSQEVELPGLGAGAYLYRVVALDGSNNASAFVDAPVLPVVLLRDVTPPPTPVILEVRSGQRQVSLRWRRSAAPDIAAYWIWRHADADLLADVRRTTPTTTLAATSDDDPVILWTDEDLDGPATWYYRVAAVDTTGNVSDACATVVGKVVDTTPPEPPAWERATWLRIDSSGGEHDWSATPDPGDRVGIALRCLATETSLTCDILRKADGERFARVVVRDLAPVETTDPEAEDARRFEYFDEDVDDAKTYRYRVVVCDPAGNRNLARFDETAVDPPA